MRDSFGKGTTDPFLEEKSSEVHRYRPHLNFVSSQKTEYFPLSLGCLFVWRAFRLFFCVAFPVLYIYVIDGNEVAKVFVV